MCITTEEPNNLVMLNNGIIVKITSLGYSYDNIKIIGMQWMQKKSIFEYPTSSTNLHMWQLKNESSILTIKFKLKDIYFKMVQLHVSYKKIDLNYEKIYAIPLLHNYN